MQNFLHHRLQNPGPKNSELSFSLNIMGSFPCMFHANYSVESMHISVQNTCAFRTEIHHGNRASKAAAACRNKEEHHAVIEKSGGAGPINAGPCPLFIPLGVSVIFKARDLCQEQGTGLSVGIQKSGNKI